MLVAALRADPEAENLRATPAAERESIVVGGERVGEEGHRKALPGEIGVPAQEAKRLGRASQALDLGNEVVEAGAEPRPQIGVVEIGGEGRDRTAVELEPTPGVSACGEQQL
jgi:hypothetical protein